MTTTTPQHSVVVAVDGSAASDRAVRWAADEAAREHRSLHLLHAYVVSTTYAGGGLYSALSDTDARLVRDDAWQVLSRSLQLAQGQHPELPLTTELVESPAAGAIVDASRLAHVVVLGARGRSALSGLLLGSVSAQVATHAACPVVVVKDREAADRPRDGVVVGVDGVTDSQPALAYAFEHAAARGTSLEVVHAWLWRHVPLTGPLTDAVAANYRAENAGQLVLAEALAGWTEKYPDVPVTRTVRHGEAVPELLQRAEGAELLVVGSRGRGGFRGLLLGSTSHAILQHAACPVAVVRGD